MAAIKLQSPYCLERDQNNSMIATGTSNRNHLSVCSTVSYENLAKARQHHVARAHRETAKVAAPVPTTPGGFRAEIKNFEGVVPHMYRDSRGLVTVGIGFKIDEGSGKTHSISAEALTWKWTIKGKREQAKRQQIIDEFNSVSQQASGSGHGAGSFKTTLVLEPDEIEKLYNQKVDEFLIQLKTQFGADFVNHFPLSVQYALVDMAYNLGMGSMKTDHNGQVLKATGLAKYQTLKKDLEAGNWKKAGDDSGRHGPPDARNERIKQWFYHGMDSVSPGNDTHAVTRQVL